MSQIIFFNWQEQIKSYEAGQSLTGIIFPGRYCGFDTKSSSGLTLSLTHAASGIVQTLQNGSQSTQTGKWVNPQGGVIQENATVTIGAVTANSSGNPRIDLIVGNYLKPPTAVGSATYQIVTGTAGPVPVAPALPLPAQQTILGYLLVPTGTTVNLSSCTYTPATIPLLGNEARPIWKDKTTHQVSTVNSWAGDDGSSLLIVMDFQKDLITRNSFSFLNDMYTSTNAALTMLTLPADLRPTKDYYIPVITSVFNFSTHAQSVLKITTAGVVTVLDPINGSNCRVHLRDRVISLEDTTN